MSLPILLIDVQTVKDRSPVHKNMDDSLIFPEIKIAQDTSIVPALGTNLMNRLQQGIQNANLTADENYLIDTYIIDALVQFTLAGLPLTSSYQFFTKGVLQRTSENTSLPSLRDMQDLSQQYRDRGEWYRERLINYLRTNRATFPLYSACDSSQDISPEKSGFTTSMWLDDY